MSALAFAVRSLVRQPGRAVLGVAGIAATGALLFDMLLLSRGLLLSFSDLLASGGYDVRIVGATGLAGVTLLLAYEHWLVRPDDLSRVNRAFFQVNGIVSVGLFVIVLLQLAWRV